MLPRQVSCVLAFIMVFPSVLSCQLETQGQKTPRGSTTVHVYPGEAPQGQGHVSHLASIPWNDVGPGSVILLHADRPFDETLYVRSSGLADEPIVIKSAGTRAVINGSVVLANTANIVLENLTIQNSEYPSVVIKDKTHSVTVSRCTIANSGLGVWITEGAGSNHLIRGNKIHSHSTHGVAIDRVNCEAGRETVIANNEIHNNAHHGIEINGSWYIVEGNDVYENGSAIPGTSGIHVFSKSEKENSGDHNIIRYNSSHHNREDRGPDGNGIQLDQWCDDNVVHHNVSYDNDGAGISIFDAASCKVYNNTTYANMIDPGKSHPYRAELVLASDYTKNVDRVENMAIKNNIFVATRPSVYAVYVDASTANNELDIGNNLYYHSGGASFYFWKDNEGNSIDRWNAILRNATHDLYGSPDFVVAAPKAPEHFRLKPSSPGVNKGVQVPSTRDLMGSPVPGGARPDLGAVESN